MKVVKIILAAVLTFAFIKSCNDLSDEEPRNANMYLGIIFVFLLIPAYLIYSAIKSKKTDTKTESKGLGKF